MDNPLKYSLTTRFKDRHILRFLNPLKGKKILDVGCGIGYISGLLTEQGATVFGVDIDQPSLRISQKNIRGSFFSGSALALPFKEKIFDGAVIADVIEHLPDANQAVREIYRVLRAGATVVVSTPFKNGWLAGTSIKEKLIHGKGHECQTHYCSGYDKNELFTLFKTCGIEPALTAVTNPFSSELLLGLVKLVYRMKRSLYRSQSELLSIQDLITFKIYTRFLFPWMYAVGRFEERFLGHLIPGHCIVISGVVKK